MQLDREKTIHINLKCIQVKKVMLAIRISFEIEPKFKERMRKNVSRRNTGMAEQKSPHLNVTKSADDSII